MDTHSTVGVAGDIRAVDGHVLLVRVSNGREWRVAVPERTDEEGGFTVAGANLLPPRPPAEHTPSYGRPIGMRMPPPRLSPRRG